MRMRFEFKWETIFNSACAETIRAKVKGGWLVQTTVSDAKRLSTSSVYIPDSDHQWQIIPPEPPKTADDATVDEGLPL